MQRAVQIICFISPFQEQETHQFNVAKAVSQLLYNEGDPLRKDTLIAMDDYVIYSVWTALKIASLVVSSGGADYFPDLRVIWPPWRKVAIFSVEMIVAKPNVLDAQPYSSSPICGFGQGKFASKSCLRNFPKTSGSLGV